MTRLSSYLGLLRPRQRPRWSISIYAGRSPTAMAPHPRLGASTVLDVHSLGKIRASGVADPFMVRHAGSWAMFFEIENLLSGRGEIGLATSDDALSWKFERIVLAEPFHLSYPHVWEFEGSFFMLPEASACDAMRLYKSSSFPFEWRLEAELLPGDFADATPFFHDGRWWIIALQGFRSGDRMNAYHAPHPLGPWTPHVANPLLTGDRRAARPAGRVVQHGGSLVRFAQDYETRYGCAVHAFRIDLLTPGEFRQSLIASDILGATGAGWNASGMHHVDAHCMGPDDWIACVDGRESVWHSPFIDAVRRRVHRADTPGLSP